MQCRAYPFLVPCNLTWMGEDASLRNPALPSFSWEHGSDYIVTRSQCINCLKRPSLYLLDSLLKEVCIMSAFLSVPHLWARSGWESIWVSHNLTFLRAKDSPLNCSRIGPVTLLASGQLLVAYKIRQVAGHVLHPFCGSFLSFAPLTGPSCIQCLVKCNVGPTHSWFRVI